MKEVFLVYANRVPRRSESRGNIIAAQYLESLKKLQYDISDEFVVEIERFKFEKSNLFTTGVGASYQPAQSLAHALASLGLNALAVSTTDLLHGGLGRLKANDLIFVFSNSGKTSEIKNLLKICQNEKIITVQISGSQDSSVRSRANINLGYTINNTNELVANVPSTSLLAQYIIAFTIVKILELKFNVSLKGKFHPSGQIGLSNLQVKDFMRTNVHELIVDCETKVDTALKLLNKFNLGMLLVSFRKSKLGIVTDGDLRRLLIKRKNNIDLLFNEKIGDHATLDPKVINPNASLYEVLELF
jgi:arabinose-5-phosphate isomerase